MTVATLPPITASPGPTLRIGQRELTPEQVFRYLSTSKLLPQFVRDIVLEDALQGVPYTEEELNAAIQAIVQQRQNQHLGIKSLSLLALRSLRLEKFKLLSWGNNLESYFLKRRQDLDQVVCSLIQTPDASLAQELYFRIQNQEDSFESLAQQYSQSSETQQGGKLGPLPLSQIHPEIAKHLRGLQPGQMSPVFILGQQCILIRLDQLIPAQLTEPMRQSLLNELFENWLEHESAKELGLVLPTLIQEPEPIAPLASQGIESMEDLSLPSSQEPVSSLEEQLTTIAPSPTSDQEIKPRYTLAIPSRPSPKRNNALPIAASVIGGILVAGVGASYWLAHEEAVEATPFSPSVQIQAQSNLLQPAYDRAITAATLAQMAQTPEQWSQVVQHWQAALSALSEVPQGHPQYTLAQQKQGEYERNLRYAEQQQAAAQDSFRLAVEAATAAASQGQSATTEQDWLTIASLWQTALEEMQAVPSNHPRYAIAQQRIPIYQANGEYAQYRSQRAGGN
jgi:hypothetical protein